MCREGNITCRAYGVGQRDAYKYIIDTEGKESIIQFYANSVVLCCVCIVPFFDLVYRIGYRHITEFIQFTELRIGYVTKDKWILIYGW